MRKEVIKAYEEIDEENRLQSSLARKIEYLMTIETLNRYIKENTKVLDCGCGVGVYSKYYSKKGANVTAIDLVPTHISKLKVQAKQENLKLDAKVLDATCLKGIPNNTFDVVLCLGPLYHLTEEDDQHRCIEECLRVCKDNGIIAFSYLSPYTIFPCAIRGNVNRISEELYKTILDEQKISAQDQFCFWTDMAFHDQKRLNNLLKQHHLKIIDNIATDGQSIAFQNVINNLNPSQFKIWLEYHKKICRQPSIIETSNHGLVITKKVEKK